MHIAIVTAGGAGMFCGSCMHDNTWARSLKKEGARVTLVPDLHAAYASTKPTRARGKSFSAASTSISTPVRQFWRKVPRALTRWLDRPAVLDLVTRFGISNNAKQLGELTLAMLAGEAGPQSREVNELADFLVDSLRPDAIFFSNALLVGAVGAIRRRYSGRIFCVLQGDDIFLEDLHEPYRSQALAAIGERARDFDGFFVHSAYYRDFMTDYLGLPAEKFHIVPLGIDLAGHDGVPERAKIGEEFTIGYFARICPEKGLHQLVEAFRLLHKRHPNTRLRAAGYLGTRDREYFEKIRGRGPRSRPGIRTRGEPADARGKSQLPQVARRPLGADRLSRA